MAKITIEVTDNGYIRIDATDAGARALGAVPWDKEGGARIEALAARVATGPVRQRSFRIKRGLSNVGWTATFVDVNKQRAFFDAHGTVKAGGVPNGNYER